MNHQLDKLNLDLENTEKDLSSSNNELKSVVNDIKNMEETLKRLVNKKSDIEKDILDSNKRIEIKSKEIADFVFKSSKSTEPIKEKISNVEESNKEYYSYQELLKKKSKKDKLRDEYENKTKKIKELRDSKIDIFKNAKFPIEGVTFNEHNIYVNEIPFSQLCSSDQIVKSCKIAMSTNPKVKIMLIKDGSLLDEDTFKNVVDLVEKEGYQLWVETVGNGHSDDCLIIKEGVLNAE